MSSLKKKVQQFKLLDYKTSIKTFTPYFIAVLTGVTTYFLYSYFNREIIRIQSISVRPKEIVLTIDRTLQNKLSKFTSESSIERIQNGATDLTSINKEYVIESLKSLQKKSSDLDDRIKQLSQLKSQVNEIKTDSISNEEIEKINSSEDIDFDDEILFPGSARYLKRKKAKQLVIDETNKTIDKVTKTKTDIDLIIKTLAIKSKKALDDNKDKFQIEIIVFNEGNQQTVVRNKGSLLLGQTQINLKRASFLKIEDYYSKLSKAISGKYHQDGSSSNYIIIEPKSFIVLNLEIDIFNNKNRDIEVIKREYLSGQSSVELTLYDIKNNPIKPYTCLLQNDIEFDPNDELLKYIIPYLGE
ncbi:hypothetical protein ACHRVW_14170 [Flavobacterium collinsii]|uniref:hypothetical protein n=1 Tax=Flavobacterium collinsii TaxID=1114861 RepID=UPI0037569981